jgi:rhodanese-related sulfurtransferase
VLEELPAETELWPGHVGGSTCGTAAIDMKTSSTLGYERAHNPLLSLDADRFVAAVNSDLGTRPANYEAIVEINRGPLQSAVLEPDAVTAEEAEALLRDGVVAVDVRPAGDFDDAHIPGSVSFPAGPPGFAPALAQALGDQVALLLVGAVEAAARRAWRHTESVGLSRPVAVLAGGFPAWTSAGLPVDEIASIDATQMEEHLAGGGIQLIDVRDASTFAAGSLPGAVNAVHTDLTRIPAGIDPAAPVAVFCKTGKRAGIGASLLRRAGAERVIHVKTGPPARSLSR